MAAILKLLWATEIHQEPELESCCLEVIEHLRRMCRQQRGQCFSLDDDLVKANEIGEVVFIQRLALVENL